MSEFHPIQSLLPVEFFFPMLGTKEPLAVLRYVDVELDGEPTSRWRAVTFKHPRRLIGAGYFRELEDAAMACHQYAIQVSVPAVLNDATRNDGM